MNENPDITGVRTEVDLTVDIPVEQMWAAVTDIARIGEWSPECTYAGWLDGRTAPEVGARFEARNRYANGAVSQVVCEVTAAEAPYAFGWKVWGGDPETDAPSAFWHYELRAAERPDRTRVRQSFTHGPGASGVSDGVQADPANAEAMLQGRLAELRRNMTATIEGMVRDVKGRTARPS